MAEITLTLPNDLTLGSKLYFIRHSTRTIFAICPVCKGTQKVPFYAPPETEGGVPQKTNLTITCPRCFSPTRSRRVHEKVYSQTEMEVIGVEKNSRAPGDSCLVRLSDAAGSVGLLGWFADNTEGTRCQFYRFHQFAQSTPGDAEAIYLYTDKVTAEELCAVRNKVESIRVAEALGTSRRETKEEHNG